jgi:hypothetical protein
MGNSSPAGHVADALGETLGVPADFRGVPWLFGTMGVSDSNDFQWM